MTNDNYNPRRSGREEKHRTRTCRTSHSHTSHYFPFSSVFLACDIISSFLFGHDALPKNSRDLMVHLRDYLWCENTKQCLEFFLLDGFSGVTNAIGMWQVIVIMRDSRRAYRSHRARVLASTKARRSRRKQSSAVLSNRVFWTHKA